MVLIGEPTNEDLDVVVAKWWGTMTAIASLMKARPFVTVGPGRNDRRPGDKGLSTKSFAYRRDKS